MRPKSKSMLLGAALGTFLLGPGYGTIVGAVWGGQKHDEETRDPSDRSADNDKHDPNDHRLS